MQAPRKPSPKSPGNPGPGPDKPAIRLDDLIPTAKVLGGRSVTFGARTKPLRKPAP